MLTIIALVSILFSPLLILTDGYARKYLRVDAADLTFYCHDHTIERGNLTRQSALPDALQLLQTF
jgi:hypothetical protein